MSAICENCRHVHQVGTREGQPAYVCRRHPPQVTFLVVAKAVSPLQPNLMRPVEEKRSAFPDTVATWSCGEYAPRMELP